MNKRKLGLVVLWTAILLAAREFHPLAAAAPPAPAPQPAAAPVPKSPADASPATPSAAPSAKRETPTGSKPIQGEVIDVPNGTPDELLQFIGRLLRTRPAGQDRPQKIANFMEMQRAIVKAADKILADKAAATDDANGSQLTLAALTRRLQALGLLDRLGDKTADRQIAETLARHVGDKRPLVAALVNQATMERRFTPPRDADAKALRAKIDDVKGFLSKTPLRGEYLAPLIRLARIVELTGSAKDAAELYEFLAQQAGKSADPRLAELAPRLSATARRVGLVGKPLEVFGKRLDGQELDWKSYQGKVVLVDFWATWCGPCLEELPNVLKQYRAYHDRGFEVIGVSIDERREAVDQFVQRRNIPWPILFSDDPHATGWEQPLAAHYGIISIPTVILVDRQGKVVSLNARGPELAALLLKLLGPPEKGSEKESQMKPVEDKAQPEKKSPTEKPPAKTKSAAGEEAPR